MKNFYSLSYAQKDIWNIEEFYPNTSIANIAGSLKFEKELDAKLLERAINLLLKKTLLFEFAF